MLDRGSCPVEAMPCLCQRFLVAARLLNSWYLVPNARPPSAYGHTPLDSAVALVRPTATAVAAVR